MKLSIILFAIFAICFGLLGWTNARDSSNDDEVSLMQPSLSEKQIESTNFFLVTPKKFSTIQYSTNKLNISNIEIESNSQSNFKSYDSVGKITYNCENKNIYMLKYNASNETKKTLDVIQYNENNEFKIIKQVENMFDNAVSITSDYKTGKIYWAVNDHGNYSIQETDVLFSQPNYIIYPNNKIRIGKIQVFPKRSEIFFSEGNNIWYTSNSPNATPKLLLTSYTLIDFAIDYAKNNLCWLEQNLDPLLWDILCVNIDTSSRPIVKSNYKFKRVGHTFGNLGTFNNTLYWTTTVRNEYLLYAKNGYEKSVKLGTMGSDKIQSFVSLNCPSTSAAASTV